MINEIGVIGAGVIGTGVATVFAKYGFKTITIDIDSNQLECAKQKIKQDIRYYNLLHKGTKITADEIFDSLTFSTNINDLSRCKFIIENVTENWDIKKNIYLKIDKICAEECIVGVNTSAIPITKIASLTSRKEKIIGIHFMNPVTLITHLEVIKGEHTSTETIEKTTAYLSNIDKTITIVNDFPGFVSNRISHLFMNEAAFTVQDQVAKPEDVDIIFKNCFGHKMGPLQTADLIGLDTVLNTLIVLYENFRDPKYRPCPLLAKMVDAGYLGVKSGKGFYTYTLD